MINLKCDQDLAELGIINPGGWNMLAFWDHLDSCDKCREAQVAQQNIFNIQRIPQAGPQGLQLQPAARRGKPPAVIRPLRRQRPTQCPCGA